MKNIRLHPLVVVLAGVFAQNGMAADSPFSPFAQTPLIMQATPGTAPPPNVLVFIDNSYDGARHAKSNAPAPVSKSNNDVFGQSSKDLRTNIAKRAVVRVAGEYPEYRWGVSAYSPNNLSMGGYIGGTGLCFEPASWYNSAQLGCTFVTDFGADITQKLYQHEAGSQLVMPIQTRDPKDYKAGGEFADAVYGIKVWGGGSAAHASPLTTAYYEMTRYYRGMRSAYKKPIPEYAINGDPEVDEVEVYSNSGGTEKDTGYDTDCWDFTSLSTGGSAKFGKGIMLGEFTIEFGRRGGTILQQKRGEGGFTYSYPEGQKNPTGYVKSVGPHGDKVESDMVCGVPLKMEVDTNGKEYLDIGWLGNEFASYRVDILLPTGGIVYEYDYPFRGDDGKVRLKEEIIERGTVLNIYRIGRPHLKETKKVVGGGQYISPIQYRCQSNNIIVITSAKDFFLSNYNKEKRGFYEAYHTDPLYKHDHPEYSQPYNGGFKRLVTADLIGEAPSSLVLSEQAKNEEKILTNYNNIFYPSRYKGDGNDYFGLGPAYSLKQYVQTMRKGEMERYNPYMDVVEDISRDTAALRGIHDLDGQTSTGVRWSSAAGYKKHENVYLRNAYNERTGLESYAHLAQAGDIIAKGKEYAYPAALTSGLQQSSIKVLPSGLYNGCHGDKCLIYQDPTTDKKKSIISAKDGEGKAWDGTDDSPDKTQDTQGNEVLVDYKETFGRQKINTFTIGFGLVEATPEDFPVLTINRFGIAGQPYFTELGYIGDLNDQQRKNHRTLTIGNVLLVQDTGDPLAQDCAERAKNLLEAQKKKLDKDRENYADNLRDDPERDKKLKVFDQEIKEEKARYQKEHDLKKENCGWVSVKREMEIREKGEMKEVPGKEIRTTTGPISGTLHLGKANGSYYLYLDYDIRKKIYVGSDKEAREGLKVGDKVKLVSSEAYKNLSDPSITADEMLRRTAQKGGGAYFSMNVADEEALVKNLRNILSNIEVGLVSMRVGAGIATNDTSSITSAVSTTLDAQRWLSELRFYELDDKTGKIKKTPRHKVADYSQKRVNLFNTPAGLKTVTVTGNSVQIDGFADGEDANRIFGISKNNANLGGLGVSVSGNDKEYENLLKWLTRATANDRVDIFRRKKTDSSGPAGELMYRDRDPNNAEAKGAMARYMGDVLDSNIDLFGVPESGRKNKPYLAIGSNDGMLHILRAADADNAEKPYYEAASYVPGMAQRQSAQDTILNNLVFTAEKNYGSSSNPHQYFVNGKLFYRETDEKDGKRGLVTLTGTLGQGGRGAYALRIGGVEYHSTRAAGLDNASGSLKEQLPLWDTSSGNFGGASTFGANTSLGYTIGGVQVGRVFGASWTPKYDPKHASAQDVRYATFLSSGFNAPFDKTGTEDKDVKPSLYVLDHLGLNVAAPNATTGSKPDTADRKAAGSLIAKIETTDDTVAGKKYGLAEPLFVDLNRDGISDLVYAGDQQGNMWRFDLRGTKDKWNASKVFQGNGQPITTAPTVYYRRSTQKEGEREVIVLFGTGSALYQSDMKDTSLQTFYGVYDKVDNGCYSKIGDEYQYNNNRCVAQTVKAGDLLTQTITQQGKMTPPGATEPVDYRVISKNKFDAAVHKGWKVDLSYNNQREGERVVVSPIVVASPGNNSASVIFATRIFQVPEKDETQISCTPEMVNSKSWLMALDARNGSEPGIVNLGYKVKNHDKREVFVAGYSVAGAIMNLVLPSKYNDEINDQSAGREGQAMALGEIEERPICEDGTVEVAFGIAGSNSDIGKHAIVCAPIPDMRRLSWRELF